MHWRCHYGRYSLWHLILQPSFTWHWHIRCLQSFMESIFMCMDNVKRQITHVYVACKYQIIIFEYHFVIADRLKIGNWWIWYVWNYYIVSRPLRYSTGLIQSSCEDLKYTTTIFLIFITIYILALAANLVTLFLAITLAYWLPRFRMQVG